MNSSQIANITEKDSKQKKNKLKLSLKPPENSINALPELNASLESLKGGELHSTTAIEKKNLYYPEENQSPRNRFVADSSERQSM